MLEQTLLNIVVKINAYLSDYILIFLLVGVGLFYSIKTRFVQVRCFGEGMKKVFGNIKLFGNKEGSAAIGWGRILVTAVLMVLCVAALASQSYNPFIYFRF